MVRLGERIPHGGLIHHVDLIRAQVVGRVERAEDAPHDAIKIRHVRGCQLVDHVLKHGGYVAWSSGACSTAPLPASVSCRAAR